MSVVKQATASPASGGRKVRILVIDDDKGELYLARRMLGAGHRELTFVHTDRIEDAVSAFNGHDIVVTDNRFDKIGGKSSDLKYPIRDAGVQITRQIKDKSPATVVVIQSAQPPELGGNRDEADYTISKRDGRVRANDGKNTMVMEKEVHTGDNLKALVELIERDRLRFTQ